MKDLLLALLNDLRYEGIPNKWDDISPLERSVITTYESEFHALIAREVRLARLNESKGYCDDGHYHDYENDEAMLPSERTRMLEKEQP